MARYHYPCLAKIVLKAPSLGLVVPSLLRPNFLSDWGTCPRTLYCLDIRCQHSRPFLSLPSHDFSSSTCVELGKSLFERFGSELSLPCQELSMIARGFEHCIKATSVVSYPVCSTTPQCNQASSVCLSLRCTFLGQSLVHTTPCPQASLLIGNPAYA